jgi:hypothetical protein
MPVLGARWAPPQPVFVPRAGLGVYLRRGSVHIWPSFSPRGVEGGQNSTGTRVPSKTHIRVCGVL